ncbi:MAG: oligosaccharyltransferase complex subunit epsilon [Alyxoria varia]|nr:MAG: oligosaccharyltransferase complex subunit epsilon [Alyxoria varia]
MPSKRQSATQVPPPSEPSASPPSVTSSSMKPSTAASSQSTTSSSAATPRNQQQNQQSKVGKSGKGSTTVGGAGGIADVLTNLWNRYDEQTPSRTKTVDVFMGFLMVVGVLQFVYVCAVGSYPFNAFLSGFSATVGQFVLTASLRIQTNPQNRAEFAGGVSSDERAFADFVFSSLVLHFFCVNFIN